MTGSGEVVYNRFDYHRRAVESEREGFFLRISGPGDYRYQGADLGILITRGRLMTDDFQLNERAHAWIKGLRGRYRGEPLSTAPAEAQPSFNLESGAFKIL